MGYDVIIFDLDGTIVDTNLERSKCIEYTANKLSLSFDANKTRGHVSAKSLREFYKYTFDIDDIEADIAIYYHRQYGSSCGIQFIKVNTKAKSLLEIFYNKKVFLATMRDTDSAIKILKHFNLYKYFLLILGNTNSFMTSKCGMIDKIIKYAGVSRDNAVLIGDSILDAIAANNEQISFIDINSSLSFIKSKCV